MASTISVLAEITVSGVFSSCDISATSCFCCFQDFSTGAVAILVIIKLMTKNPHSESETIHNEFFIRSRSEASSYSLSKNAIFIPREVVLT